MISQYVPFFFFSPSQTEVSVVTLFCTQEHGLLLQDCFPKPSGLQALLALDVPYYCFSCKVRTENTLFRCCVAGGGLILYLGFLTRKFKAGCFKSKKRSLLVVFLFTLITYV